MEAKYLSSMGVTELNVISQDTSRYGSDINNSLANLLDTLASLNKFKLIRVLYLYPDEITDELLEVTPKTLRIRKKTLDARMRKREKFQ